MRQCGYQCAIQRWVSRSSLLCFLILLFMSDPAQSASTGTIAQTGNALTLVSDGQPRAIVVIAAAPSRAAKQASALFVAQIERISGAKLDIVKDSDLGNAKVDNGVVTLPAGKIAAKAFVLIGESDLARKLGGASDGLGAGGIRIKTFPNALALLGADEKTPLDNMGTHYAVTTFLEDALGFRFLWPGESGLVAPPRRTIQVPPLDVRFTPAIQQRRIRSVGYNDRLQVGLDHLGLKKEDYDAARKCAMGSEPKSPNWFGWQRIGGSLGVTAGHAFGYIWGKYGKEHPDWFALQPNGSRDMTNLTPERARLCKSNPALIAAIARDKIEEIQRTGKHAVSICPNDGGQASFCLCENCKKLDPPEGRKVMLWDRTSKPPKEFEYVSLTDRTVRFYNAIAEKVTAQFPDALLAGYAYSAYAAPPVREKVHPSVVIGFVNIDYLQDSRRKQGLADWDAWSKVTQKMYWRPNLLLSARREGTPALFPHKIAEDFRYLAHHSMIGTDFDSCAHNWAVQGLNYYVLAKLHWNPDLKVDELIDDYCRAGFGPAAKEAKRYLARIEQLTDRIAAEECGITVHYTPEVIVELRGLLESADKAAAADEPSRRRVAFLRRGLEFTDIQAQCYRVADAAESKPLTPDEKKSFLALMDRKWTLMRQMFRDEPLAVNVAYVCWGGEGRFRKLGWSRPSPQLKAKVEADEQGRPVGP
ncbi:MAG: DUF4838 domain-containing protein [Candidatus Sumerlaeota bacterium]|nr:DUF4838 domain-containing protein [Candidatus Sumerlaeota bacterium]